MGEPMSPTISRGKQDKAYRYYVSTSLQTGVSVAAREDGILRRIPASTLETQLAALLTRLLPGHAGAPLALPSRIEVHADAVHVTLPRSVCAGVQGRLTDAERLQDDMTDPSSLRLIATLRIRNRRGRTDIRTSVVAPTRRDPVMIRALQRAHAMVELDSRRLPVCRTSPDTQYGRRLLRLAFLAPDLQRAILDGTQPADLTLDHLIARPIPISWDAQRRLFEHV